jgi:hypothetical protein
MKQTSIVKDVIAAVREEKETHHVRLAVLLPHSKKQILRALQYGADSNQIKRVRHETVKGVRGMPMAIYAPVEDETIRYRGPAQARSVWDYAARA